MSRGIFLLLLLAGCAATPAPTRIVTMTPEVPPAMLDCADAPDVPEASSQAVVAKYIVALWQAGQDCREHVTAIKAALSN